MAAAWSAPSRLTDDNLPDNHPTLFYSPVDGSPRLLWLKGDTLSGLLGNLSGTPRTIAVEGSSAILDYSAAQDPAGALALLWQGLSPEGVDVFYSVYDPAQDIFSLVTQLTHDQPLEKSLNPAFTTSGNLILAYNKTQLVKTDVTPQPGTTIHNVTTFGQTDLYVLLHTLGPDLALQAKDLSVSPANPAPGSPAVLSATLSNLGDISVTNPSVAFYLGNPASGGTLIGTAADSNPLAGGGQVSLSTSWTLPATDGPFEIYAVSSSSNAGSEINEVNSTASFSIALPDLWATSLAVTYGPDQTVNLTASVKNLGVSASTATAVDFRRDDPLTGALLGSTALPSLDAGAAQDVTLAWDATTSPAGSFKVYATVDPSASLVEADKTNNSTWAGAAVLPDLVLKSEAITTSRNSDGSLSVSVWVFNTGQRPADNFVVGILQSPARRGRPSDPFNHPEHTRRRVSGGDLQSGRLPALRFLHRCWF